MRRILCFFIVVALALSVGTNKTSANSDSFTVEDLMKVAYKYEGVPYIFGGGTVDGFDCSGYTKYVFNEVGISLPHKAEKQYDLGTSIKKADLKLGDLVFFSDTYKEGISHVGIYTGNNSFISATRSGGVRVDSLDYPYWKEKYTGAKRLFESEIYREYTDVKKQHFAYRAVGVLSSKGIISGYGDSTFRPDISITRGQAAAIVNRVLKNTPPANLNSFKDVSEGYTFAKDIAAIKKMNIINGFSDGTFRPNETMTRGQMAFIIERTFQLNKLDIDFKFTYSDPIPNYSLYNTINKMYAIDLTGGFRTDTYRPDDNTTRADFSAALYSGLNVK
ncbi:C40 family peptidase [Bacillus massiliigorillae]|uniref:C40 family peptidase n=1 Tax=Bacillus massiliigorillae TaxID=1243664 RepID=UPI0003A5A576|nr:C40 family peptidase [Bacillus massiliigorillae]